MSVYKPGKSPFYHYDFQLKSHRFCGSTGLTEKRAAERFEEAEKERAEQLIAKTERQGTDPMTWVVAAGRFMHEVGSHHVGKADTKRALKWLRAQIGEHMLIADMTDGFVAEIVARRRSEKTRSKTPRPVSPATVNRTCTEPMRKVLNRARDTWGQEIPKIRWENHLLPEPQERVRELSDDEEAKLSGAVRDDYLPLFRFALWTGMRMTECLRLTWPDIDWGNRLIRVHGKGGKVAAIPLEPDVRDLLFPLQGRHETAVFCYRAARTRNGRERGQWLPITQSGLKTRWRRDRAASGVLDYRWHDNRHTAATRLLRASGNLRLAQRLLRHSDLTTTAKYAHVTDNDLREALKLVSESRKNSRTKPDEGTQVIGEKKTNLD